MGVITPKTPHALPPCLQDDFPLPYSLPFVAIFETAAGHNANLLRAVVSAMVGVSVGLLQATAT